MVSYVRAKSWGLALAVALSLFVASVVPAVAQQVDQSVQQPASQSANVVGTVTSKDGRSVGGADVRLIGPTIATTRTDSRGRFNFVGVPFGTYKLLVSSSLGSTARESIDVHGDVDVAVSYQGEAPTKVIAQTVTHINATAANVASISPSDAAFEGQTSWQQILQQVPGVAVGGNLGGGNTLGTAVAGSPLSPAVVSINGALPYETSTMLDGMPLQGTSISTQFSGQGGSADLSVLPLNAFGSADVVRGPGADSPSIVNSVAGTFVLHPPGRVDKDQFDFSIGNGIYGGIVANLKAAERIGRLSATVIYGINDSPGPNGSTTITSGYGVAPATVGGQPFQSCTPPAGCVNFVPSPNYQLAYTLQDSLLLSGVPYNTHWNQNNGALSLVYEIGQAVTAQVFYAGSSTTAQSEPLSYVPASFTPGAPYAGSIAPGSYQLINLGTTTPLSQSGSLFEEKITANLGSGVLRLSALQFNSFFQQRTTSELPNGQYTLSGAGCIGTAAVSASCPNGGTLTAFNGASESLTFPPYTINYNTWTNSRAMLASYSTPIGSRSSAGISYSTDYYNQPFLEAYDIPGFAATFGFPPAQSAGTREARVDASTELSDAVTLGASYYFTNSTFHVPMNSVFAPNPSSWSDSTFNYSAPRIGLTWRLQPGTVVRLAAGGGYALPQLYQLTGSISQATNPGNEYYTLTEPNLHLKPETSFGYDLGLDTRLTPDTVLAFDAYQTNLNGQIYTSTESGGMFNGLPLYTEEYENLARSRFEGVNIDIRHEPNKGLYWRGSIGLTRAYVVNVPPGFYNLPSCTNCTNTYVIPGPNFNGEYPSTVPYANGSGSLGYRWAPRKYIEIEPTYYGNNNTFFQPAFVEFDARASYPVTTDLSLIATFRNFSNVYGQSTALGIPTSGAPTISGLPYPFYPLPYGPRTFMLTLNYKT
ncbi:MAG TPA: TonB-dependent receptor [Candidatus Baltobacteraceae bacterium]|jgi:outer membrane receptor protein involved in Fe transport